MGSWFDGAAKRAARSAANFEAPAGEADGLTRRQVLARGAVVTGVAWTAPMLMSVRPAFAGASMCEPGEDYSVCPDMVTFLCCPPKQGEPTECLLDENNMNVCDIPPGGVCGNQGEGQCNGGRSRCNQPGGNPAVNPSICGGPGTVCSDGSVCSPTSPCSVGLPNSFGDDRCGGQGSPCTSDTDCAEKTVNQPATTCKSGICAV